MNTIRFTLEEAQTASNEWNFNCGPGVLCAILDKTPAEIRPYLVDFEQKQYINPMLMATILHNLKVPFRRVYECLGAKVGSNAVYPRSGLIRIQWGGPWAANGTPVRKRYRHTHWIGLRHSIQDRREVFDVNAICIGGWISWDKWRFELVPWLLQRLEPQNNGKWWPTHCWEVGIGHDALYTGPN